ncbi:MULTISPECIES: metallophosphoesterase family protein [unclassified Oceanobacillus]|uniref:metallophosphoesterase family protein n=1 Tax=unclassified Oceanobacillus TaxID=2630292 RepID=UPI001BE715BF|nr:MULTISPECIES: metallophosphoesterase family protein [unclassified Oceanobacillus]MBT2601120.1 metallophosphoesterase family protein [Oceanobacillus sp. ISL-74]MBT2652346.1 metallophosphoesterase family protein [Oceanobacillus sp. ISL-73]
MRIAAIYDIHGNYSALKAVLEEVRKTNVEEVIVGGDLAWGPEPRQVMDLLMNYKDEFIFIRGNADREVAYRHGKEQGLDDFVADLNHWCADQLTEQQINFLKNLPEKKVLNVDGLGEVLFIHGSPRSDEEAIRINTPEEEIRPMIENVPQDIIVCGHTHIQFDRIIGGKRIINAGSIGLQSRADGACWALVGPKVELKVTTYDTRAASERINKSNTPYKKDFADHYLHPPYEGP